MDAAGVGEEGRGRRGGLAATRPAPHLRGKVTDLLIGDLFTDAGDDVWGPLESLYPPGKSGIPAWDAGVKPDDVPDKVNELYLPAGELR